MTVCRERPTRSSTAPWSGGSRSRPNPFGVRVWGRNLLNEYYAIDRIASGRGWYQLPAQPRMFGFTVLKDF